MIGEKVRKLSGEVCQGKEVDLIASGYNQTILPLAWSALISGLLDIDIELKEPFLTKIPAKNSKLKEIKEIVKELKNYLKKYWKCFR